MATINFNFKSSTEESKLAHNADQEDLSMLKKQVEWIALGDVQNSQNLDNGRLQKISYVYNSGT